MTLPGRTAKRPEPRRVLRVGMRSAACSARRTARDHPSWRLTRGCDRVAERLRLRICPKFTSYSTSKFEEKAGVGRKRTRDCSGDRWRGSPPGPKAEDE